MICRLDRISASLGALFMLAGLIGCVATTQPPSAQIASSAMTISRFVPASDPSFRFEGRFDFSDPVAPVVVWAGSRIGIDFEGSQLALRFGEAKEQNFFNVEVDGATTIVALNHGSPAQQINVLLPMGPDRHRLVIVKRSEGAKGQARFLGVEIAAGARVWTSPAPHFKLRMEYFGDSVTVGACNEDGAVDQWDDFRTHNHALSYATLTSRNFQADHRAMAVSGMGLVLGYVDVKAGQVWDKIYARADSARADLKSWQPDVAFVNLGENDDSFSRNQSLVFPAADYRAAYVALVRAIRFAYPRAQIVLLRGGMWGGAKSQPLIEAWTKAVQELEAGDAAISHYVFTHWSELHPRVSDDRAMAAELTSWLKRQPFMTRYLEN